MAKSEKKKDESLVAISKGEARHKTLRIFVICGTVVVCIAILCYTLIRVLDEPMWFKVLCVLTPFATVLAASLGPSRHIKETERYLEENSKRTKRLEESVDPNRTSSGLTPKGRSPE